MTMTMTMATTTTMAIPMITLMAIRMPITTPWRSRSRRA